MNQVKVHKISRRRVFIIVTGVLIGLILAGVVSFVRYEGIDGVWEIINPKEQQPIDCNVASEELVKTGDCSVLDDEQ